MASNALLAKLTAARERVTRARALVKDSPRGEPWAELQAALADVGDLEREVALADGLECAVPCELIPLWHIEAAPALLHADGRVVLVYAAHGDPTPGWVGGSVRQVSADEQPRRGDESVPRAQARASGPDTQPGDEQPDAGKRADTQPPEWAGDAPPGGASVGEYARVEPPRRVDSGLGRGVVVLRFERPRAVRTGAPSDETRRAHPLSGAGLVPHRPHTVVNSSWAKALRQQQVQHPLTAAKEWDAVVHYILTFEGETFECLADGVKAELRAQSVSDAARAVLSEVLGQS